MSTTIHDLQGNVVGYEDRDGTLRDKNKKKVGSLNRRNGTVRDTHNQEVGFIDGDGTVVDRYRRRLGKLNKDGTVEDWHGIPLYTGSATPLLLDFEHAPEEDEPASRLDFDEMARQKAPPGAAEFEQDARRAPPTAPHTRIAGVLMPDGYVSPSVFGCLALVGAVLFGGVLLFFFQNPSIFSRGATPTSSASALVAATVQGTPAANAQPDRTATAQPISGKVNADSLNLREGPGTTFNIVDHLAQGTEVSIAGRLQDASWLKVTVPSSSKEGWVASQYIDLQVDVKTLPVIQPPSQ